MYRFSLICIVIVAAVFLFSFNHSQAQEKEAISVEQVQSFSYACFTYKGDYKDHELVIDKAINALIAQNITPTGPMVGIYYNNPQLVKPEDLEWEIGFPIADSVNVEQPLSKKQWEFQKVARAFFVGPYEKAAEMYPMIFQWIGKHQLIPAGPAMERFLDDPDLVAADSLRTEIWIPLLENVP